MKISEVIQELERIKELAGDLPCVGQSETATWHLQSSDLFISRKETICYGDGRREPLDRSVVIGYRH